ncbi:MAG: ribonuclease P protein component [Holosporaceae bacterium]|nr:ribonuclease P protein component [Holosporaceae bacterium]
MKKDFRIRKSRDFAAVSGSGFVFFTSSVIVRCGFNGLDAFRVGFTASRRVGNAVVRNRCKRRMRAVADMMLEKIALAGVDYVLIAGKSVRNVGINDLTNDVVRAVRFLNDKILKSDSKCRS